MLSTSLPAPRFTLSVSAASAVRNTVLDASLPVTEPAAAVVAPARLTVRTEPALPVIATSFNVALVSVIPPVASVPDAAPEATTLNFSIPSAVMILAEPVEADDRLTVISSVVPIVAAAAIPTVVLALEAVTVTSGIAAKFVTETLEIEPLLITPVMPVINVASTVVAVTALTESSSIDAVITPLPKAAVAEVLDKVNVSAPSPPVRLSPALSVVTVTPPTVAAEDENKSSPAPPVKAAPVSKPVVSRKLPPPTWPSPWPAATAESTAASTPAIAESLDASVEPTVANQVAAEAAAAAPLYPTISSVVASAAVKEEEASILFAIVAASLF